MNDLLQDINEFPPDMKNTYDDTISYPSVSDDLKALSHTLAAFGFSSRVEKGPTGHQVLRDNL